MTRWKPNTALYVLQGLVRPYVRTIVQAGKNKARQRKWYHYLWDTRTSL